MQIVEASVETVRPPCKFLMRPFFDDLAVLHHDDLVGVDDGREPVGNDDHGPPAHRLFEGLLHGCLRLCVERRGRLVEKEYRSVAHQRPGDRQALPLAAG
ncbi:hypothetical protein ABIE77_001729 [Sinorhizobium fredii]